MSANFKQTLQNRPVSLRQRGFLVVECCQLTSWQVHKQKTCQRFT